MDPNNRRRRQPEQEPRGIPDARERFSSMLHQMVLRFGALREEVLNDNSKLRQEWKDARGLATLTDERIKVLEASVADVRDRLGLEEPDTVTKLRAIVASYRAPGA